MIYVKRASPGPKARQLHNVHRCIGHLGEGTDVLGNWPIAKHIGMRPFQPLPDNLTIQ